MLAGKFAEQVNRTPDQIAIKDREHWLTYRELNTYANRIAHRLETLNRDPNPNTVIGLLFEHGIDMIAALLAVLKTGNAYVPLPRDYPVNRLEYMVTHSGSELILSNSRCRSFARQLAGKSGIPFLDIDDIPRTAPPQHRQQHRENPMAYIMYTSGSTGTPRGVVQTRENVWHHIKPWAQRFHITGSDRLTLFSSFGHDASVMDIYGALLNGAALYPLDMKNQDETVELSQFLEKEKITVWHSVPTLFNYFAGTLTGREKFKHLRFIILGGEAIRRHEIDLFKRYFPYSELAGIYGQTESSVNATWMVRPQDTVNKFILGEPREQTRVFVVDPEGNEVEALRSGEILIASPYVSPGYWQDKAGTAASFAADDEFGRLYWTGDMGRLLLDGNIEFIGRKDQQVKIRGHRVEPGEIETRLLQFPGIGAAVVAAREDRQGNKYLAAYYVMTCREKNPARTPTALQLREHLAQHLPDYMIPAFFVPRERFPLTRSGKIDRRALPEPVIQTAQNYTPPQDKIEKTMAKIWAEVLAIPVESIGREDHFFELGGHSLKAAALVSLLHRALDIDISLSRVFQVPILKQLSQCVKEAKREKYLEIPRAETREYYPLSSAQKRLYFLQQMDPASTAYNMPLALPLGKETKIHEIETAIKQLIARHESLRTSFLNIDDQPVQRVHEAAALKFATGYHTINNGSPNARRAIKSFDQTFSKVWPPAGPPVEETLAVEVSASAGHSPQGQELRAGSYISSFIRPFDLSRAPLLRSRLVKMAENRYTWLLDLHHIICDGTSRAILAEDFMVLYNQGALAPLAIQYKDFSQWQNRLQKRGKIDEQQQYWRELCRGEIPRIDMPTDYKRPGVFTFAGDSYGFTLDREEAARFKALGAAAGGTLYMNLLAALNTLLYKYTGQTDIIIGSGTAGRNHAELLPVVGMFINTLVMRNRPQPGKTYETFLKEIINNSIDALANQDVQFEDLVERLEPERNTSRNPIFDITMVVQNFRQPGKTGPDNENYGQIEILPKVDETLAPLKLQHLTAKFDMTFFVQETDRDIRLTIEYYTAIFKKATMQRLAGHLKNIIATVGKNPAIKLKDIEMITPQEKNRVLYEFNDTAAKEYPQNKSIHWLIREQVERTPDNIALFGRTRGTGGLAPWSDPIFITYGQLNLTSNQLVHRLVQKGVKPDIIVGIMLARSIEMVTGMLGILKAGAAYLPIDPEYPQERIKYMLKDSGAQFLVTTPGAFEKFKKLSIVNCRLLMVNEEPHGGPGFNIPSKGANSINNYQLTIDNLQLEWGYLAYVIYTSGSTGRPKGVLVRHQGFVNLIYVHREIFGENPDTRISQVANPGFDAMAFEVWPCLSSGAALYIADRETCLDPGAMKRWLIEKRIAISFQSTAMTERLLDETWPGSGVVLNTLKTGGDRLTRYPTRQYPFTLYNLYGPTEDTVWTTYTEVKPAADGERFPGIGKPIGNHRVYIVDRYFGLQPIGIPGELCIGGEGLAVGYLNRPGLTAEKFKHDLWDCRDCRDYQDYQDYQDYHDYHDYHDYQDEKKNHKIQITKKPAPELHELPRIGSSLNKKLLRGVLGSSLNKKLLRGVQGGGFLEKSPPGRRRQKIYCTGDLCKWQSDGNIIFIGRIDYQVKIRGYRIELGEIENCLCSHKSIKEAVVTAREKNDNDKYLCAYIVPRTGEAYRELELKKHLAGELPYYMVPAHFIPLEKIPRDPNGKVDRKALPEPGMTIKKIYTPPANPIEKKLVLIWSEVLKWQGAIGIDDNFFELGGHSLTVSTMVSKVYKEFAVRIPMTEIFNTPFIRNMAQYIAGETGESFTAIESAEEKDYYVLSSAQKRLYILQQMESAHVAYNLPQLILLGQSIDIKKLESALKKLIHRHDSLRTSFHLKDGEPVQEIHRQVEFGIEYKEVEVEVGDKEGTRGLAPLPIEPAASGPQPAEALLSSFIRPFDLAHAPLLRVGVMEPPPTPVVPGGQPGQEEKNRQYILMIDMHHIITDGTSQTILKDELLSLVAGEKLPAPRLQYKDYAQWQNSREHRDAITAQQDYWATLFPDDLPVLNLPTDFPRPLTKSFAGNTISFILTNIRAIHLEHLLKEAKITLFMLVTAGFNVLLSKLSSQEDIIVGIPVMGRGHADLERVIGMFVNTLALRSYPVGTKTFAGFLQEVRESTLAAFENQDYPFDELVKQLTANRDNDRNPIFDVMFNLPGQQDYTGTNLEINEQRLHRHQKGVSKFDLTLTAVDFGGNLLCSFEYSTTLFAPRTIDRVIEYFKRIFALILENPGQKLSQIEIITGPEKNRVLYEFNQTEAEYPQNKTIDRLFAEQAKQTPDHIALVGAHESRFEGTKGLAPVPAPISISYRELSEKSRRLAFLLNERGIKPDNIAGIMLERSIEMIIGIFAILQAGGAYMPIDPDYPRERIDFMLKDSGAGILLKKSGIRNPESGTNPNASNSNKQNEISGVTVLDFEHLDFEFVSSFEFRASNFTSSNLAYVIYTSGTTGNPKGVMISHRSLVNRLDWMQKKYPIDETDTILQKTPYSFDVSLWEIFWWSITGAAVCLLVPGGEKEPGAIIDAVQRNNVTVMHFVPSMLSAFLDYLQESTEAKKLSGLKQVIASGEALTLSQVKRFNTILYNQNQTKLANLYGPTEATVDVSYFDCPTGENTANMQSIPIGKPIGNIRLHILDKDYHLQPVGSPGELFISGVGLARGYLNRPGLTAEKFDRKLKGTGKKAKKAGKAKNNQKLWQGSPDASRDGFLEKSPPGRRRHKLYKTGDLARWREDGNIEFLGRIDHQVKIRGFRIELGEIENRLLKVSTVREAVVIAGQDESGEKSLYAYIVAGHDIDDTGLRTTLSRHLPDYMVPSYFVRLEKIPLTPNGKLDRKMLPKPGSKIDKSNYQTPLDPIQKKLVEIWQQVLGMEAIGINDNFFEIGGDSIKAIQISARLQKYGIKMETRDLFLNRTIKQLSPHLQKTARLISQEPVEGEVELTPIQHWFFENFFPGRHHFNQAVMLTGPAGYDEVCLKKVFTRLVEHHDALRLVYRLNEKNNITGKPAVIQWNRGIGGELFHLEVFDFTAQGQDIEKRITKEAGRLQASIQLETGPLVKLGLFKTGRGDYLLIAIHHLAIDGVSWRILLEDFNIGYQQAAEGREIRFQEKTDSYRQWAQELKKYAGGNEILKELAYWQELEKQEIAPLPRDFDISGSPGKKCFKNRETIGMGLNHEETAKLLKEVNRAYGTEINDILLAALAMAVRQWSGSPGVLINLEGHGREKIGENLDVTRTIGWYTAQYPVLLNMPNTPDLAYTIKTVKETLRRIPGKGIGYGMLRYLTPPGKRPGLAFNREPAISFNYLGQFGQADNRDEDSSPGNGPGPGNPVNPDLEAKFAIDINGMIGKKGELHLGFTYNKYEYRAGTIKKLTGMYRANLVEIIAHCTAKEEKELTPADLTYSDFSIDELEELNTQIKELIETENQGEQS